MQQNQPQELFTDKMLANMYIFDTGRTKLHPSQREKALGDVLVHKFTKVGKKFQKGTR